MSIVEPASFLTLHYRLAGPQGDIINTFNEITEAELMHQFLDAWKGRHFADESLLMSAITNIEIDPDRHGYLGWYGIVGRVITAPAGRISAIASGTTPAAAIPAAFWVLVIDR